MKNIDLMIDIETFGTSSKAAVIQIAGVYFNIEDGEIGETFCASLDIKDVLSHGFIEDEDTKRWWDTQDQEILNEILDNGQPAEDVIKQFSEFSSKANRVWSHATFDFVILQEYLKHFNMPLMNFRHARDLRTLVDLSNIDLQYYDKPKFAHHALHDCYHQIKYTVDAYDSIYTSWI